MYITHLLSSSPPIARPLISFGYSLLIIIIIIEKIKKWTVNNAKDFKLSIILAKLL
jgi:hypothetical protein